MKRIISMLLLGAVLLGLLCGCATQPTPTEPTSEPATEPASTLSPPKDYTVTPGGIAVSTNYDAYTTKDRTVTPQFTRLSDEAMPELTARDDYGAIFPYVGTVTDTGYMTSPTYGFADSKGRLITDPVYSSISQPRSDDGTQCVWLFRKIHLTEYVDSNGVHYPDGEEYYGFATPNGSFATDCRYSSIYLGKTIVLCVYPSDYDSDDPARFDVYNFRGALLTTSDEQPYADKLGSYSWQLDCMGDTLVVPLRNGEFEDWGNNTMREKTDLYLYNIGGEEVAGPFAYFYSNIDDYYVCAVLNDQRTVILRHDGSYLFDRSFYSIGLDTRDRFTVRESEDDDYHIIDAEGNEIFTVSASRYLYWDGSYYHSNGLDGDFDYIYDINGDQLVGETDDDDVLLSGNWENITGTCIFDRMYDDHAELYNPVTKQQMTVKFDTGGYVASCTYRDGTEFPYFIVVTGSANDNYTLMDTTIYNEQFEAVLTFRGNSHTMYDSADATPYLIVSVSNELTLYNASMDAVLSVPGDLRNGLSLSGGILTCYDDRASYVYEIIGDDINGKRLICYPLYSLLDD